MDKDRLLLYDEEHKDMGFDFDTQDEKQKPYFGKFVEWLKSGSDVGVLPASEYDDKRGIDLWVRFGDGELAPVQVKVDFHMATTHNMAVEIISQAYYGKNWKQGWMAHLHNTTYLVYIDGMNNIAYIYKSADIYAHVIHNVRDFKSIAVRNTPDGGQEYFAICVLVPIRGMENLLVEKVYLENPRGKESSL